jgi:hypothetical protein
MDHGSSSFRKRDRLELHIPVRVRCRETNGMEWHELSRVEDVTQFGASFFLEHGLDVGRIVHLSLPLPWRLRQFDQSEDLYRVYALVRWVRAIEAKFLIGVAFIGKTPPSSYLHDPSRIYGTGGYTEKRKESRIEAALQMQLETVDDRGEVVASELTVTTNISRHGATCYTTLDTKPGSFVRVVAQDVYFVTTAVVRARRADANGIPTIHLEFIGNEWPIELSTEDDG